MRPTRTNIVLFAIMIAATAATALPGVRGWIVGPSVETIAMAEPVGLEGLLAKAGVETIRIDDRKAPLSVVVVASLDCSHCIDFEANGGLDRLVEFGEATGRGVGYVHLGSTAGALAIGSLEACAADTTTADATAAETAAAETTTAETAVTETGTDHARGDGKVGRDRIAADFAAARDLRSVIIESRAGEGSGAADVVQAELDRIGGDLGLSREEVRSCLGKEGGYQASRARLADLAGIEATPTFLFRRLDGTLGRITGFSSSQDLEAAIVEP